jgi:hypothetical protein
MPLTRVRDPLHLPCRAIFAIARAVLLRTDHLVMQMVQALCKS